MSETTESKESADVADRLDGVVRLLNWPKTKTNGYVPWYVMLWRLVFMPLIYGGLALAWVGVAMANGPKQACRFWNNAT